MPTQGVHSRTGPGQDFEVILFGPGLADHGQAVTVTGRLVRVQPLTSLCKNLSVQSSVPQCLP
jgi:hypothetical protein